jgi:hypothetical protein
MMAMLVIISLEDWKVGRLKVRKLEGWEVGKFKPVF